MKYVSFCNKMHHIMLVLPLVSVKHTVCTPRERMSDYSVYSRLSGLFAGSSQLRNSTVPLLITEQTLKHLLFSSDKERKEGIDTADQTNHTYCIHSSEPSNTSRKATDHCSSSGLLGFQHKFTAGVSLLGERSIRCPGWW